MGRHILVTGATGETGRYTTDLLISQGKIRAYVHKAEERSDKLKACGAEIVVGDLLYFGAARPAVTVLTPLICLSDPSGADQ